MQRLSSQLNARYAAIGADDPKRHRTRLAARRSQTQAAPDGGAIVCMHRSQKRRVASQHGNDIRADNRRKVLG
jgi:hypothetical protein